MRKHKLLEDQSKLSYDAVSPTAHTVVAATTGSPFIAKGATLVVPLVAALTPYDADVNAIPNPTPAQTAHRDQLRTAVCTELGRLAKRLNLDYPGDEPALLSSGLTMADTTATSTARAQAVAGAVMGLEVLDGRTPGYLLLKFTRPPGTLQNLVRLTADPLLPENQWDVVVGGGREREVGPFPSGSRVRTKAAALTGSTTEPLYSPVVSRLVQ